MCLEAGSCCWAQTDGMSSRGMQQTSGQQQAGDASCDLAAMMHLGHWEGISLAYKALCKSKLDEHPTTTTFRK